MDSMTDEDNTAVFVFYVVFAIWNRQPNLYIESISGHMVPHILQETVKQVIKTLILHSIHYNMQP